MKDFPSFPLVEALHATLRWPIAPASSLSMGSSLATGTPISSRMGLLANATKARERFTSAGYSRVGPFKTCG